MEIKLPKTQIDYARLQEAKSLFVKGLRAKSVYHYTSISGLQGILSSKTLRFTNIKYMNDKDEIVAGLDSMAKVLNVDENERKAMLSSFIRHGAQTFVCCFSLDADSLPMWNYYTKEINNQGYNIEFDDKKLVESILRSNPLLDGCDISFGNIDYSKDNNSEYSQAITSGILSSVQIAVSKLFIAVMKGSNIKPSTDTESSLKDWESLISDSEKKQKLTNLPIYFFNGENCKFGKDVFGNYIFFVKRDHFIQEQEFRIVITVPDKLLPKLKENGLYKFRISNGVLVPYLELAFSEDVVKSVTISPTVQSDLVEQSIQDFMNYCNYKVQDFSEFIKHSKVPVRF